MSIKKNSESYFIHAPGIHPPTSTCWVEQTAPFASTCENVALVNTVMVIRALDWARLLRVFFVLVWCGVDVDRRDTVLLFMAVAEIVRESLMGSLDGVDSVRFAALNYGFGLRPTWRALPCVNRL
jgi:hypothetical protein